ncbi:hypothetical protein [Marinifilum caeruleilacunae]|uniref:GLPGLI family protein n=1 Tax=Marinifilum caeruleilacunae TaxID=2499076 RepID=A0ABX1WYH2_9BACT|nr:hypothetical protein [Marinifilum caeruleilacunae]NOU61198.1 hypothetical protein [Marinifilum caeruleilacunae]
MRKLQMMLFILCLSLGVKAQTSANDVRLLQESIRDVYDSNIFNGSNPNYEVYLDDWDRGVIYSKLFTHSTIAPIRYFVYNNEFHLVNNTKDTVVLNKFAQIDSIVVADKKFIFTSYNMGTRTQTDYFQELACGKIKLLKHYTCVFVKGNQRIATGYHTNTPNSYKIATQLFYQEEGQPAVLLPKKKNEIIALFDDPELAAYAKENKIKFKKEKHLQKLFKHVNAH